MPSKAKRGAIPVRPHLPSAQPAPASASVSPASTGPEKANLQLQQASPPNGQGADPTGDTTESAGEPNAAPAGHAAQPNGNSDAASRPPPRGPPKGYFTQPSTADYASLPPQDYADGGSANDNFYSGDEDLDRYAHPGQSHANSSQEPSNAPVPRTPTAPAPPRPNFPAVSNAALRSAHRMGDSLWNPSTQAERENIKQFWLGLGEDERRSLVKIEKEAVLRKMKEQQKHSCSCSVCGRKRTAIEEELEVLYDAYYEELEQFANHNPGVVNAPQLVAPPRSLQAHGILTVADDLLKNDGRHFIDMMEQLAERRMAREEEDSMTEEQRMEEGRRMFQIFAARMFEQRVLTAYREKVAAERQAKLLEELEEEDRLDNQREQKKAPAAREAEEKKQEEQRVRREEQRKKREAERKAAEEERLRKEAEKQKRIQEQKERQAEAERRQREAKERERQKKEAAKKKEREEREAREHEARQRKAHEAEERRQKEEQARKAREAAARLDDQQAKSQQPPRAQPVALPPGLLQPQRPAQLQSPSFPIASPVVPAKVPTPVRNRQPSHSVQTVPSHASSPRSQQAATDMSSASPASGIVSHQSQVQPLPNKTPIQPPMLHHPQPSAPRSPLNNTTRGQYGFNINGLPGYGVGAPPTSAPGLLSTILPQAPLYQGPPVANARYGPNSMHFHPPFGGPRHFPPGQHPMPFQPQTTGAPPLQQPPVQPPQPLHSRQASGSTTAETASQPAPIARPPPGAIGKPPSTTPDRQKQKQGADQDVDQITTALGSKALLDDSDEPIPTVSERSSLVPLGAPGTGRLSFASTFADSKQASFGGPGQGWGGFSGAQSWGAPASQVMATSWPQQPFGSLGGIPPPVHRPHVSRPFAVRILLAQACRQLSITGETWHPAQAILHHVNLIKSPNEAPISMDEMLGLAETEGNAQNGGGSFELADHGRGVVIKFVEDSAAQPRNSVGDIGSPLPHHSQPTPFPSGQSAFGLPGRGF
ncbi:hypothetical protein DV735_g4604, partial [Chaetothyriales sp. CBS 134920]